MRPFERLRRGGGGPAGADQQKDTSGRKKAVFIPGPLAPEWARGAMEITLGLGAGLMLLMALHAFQRAAEAPPEVVAADEGCPLLASFEGYSEHARALIGRDEGRKAYPRTIRILTAPDGSWVLAYDPIGTGEYGCVADQGVGFRVSGR